MPTARQLAMKAHRVLEEYVRIHEVVFGDPAQRRDLLVPRCLSPEEFTKQTARLRALDAELARIRSELWTTGAGTTAGPLFTFALNNYVAALRLAVAKLESICHTRVRDADEARQSAGSCDRNVRDYRILRAQYRYFGEDLNRRFLGRRSSASSSDSPAVPGAWEDASVQGQGAEYQMCDSRA